MDGKSLWTRFMEACGRTGNKPHEVFMKDVGFPANAEKAGFDTFVASPAGMPPGLQMYLDGDGDTAYKFIWDSDGFSEHDKQTEEWKRGMNEQRTTVNATTCDDTTVYCCKADLTADANGDIGVINTGKITPDISGYRVELLKVHAAWNIENTVGGARMSILSNDATPVQYHNVEVGDTLAGPWTLEGQALAGDNKHFAIAGGGCTNGSVYTLYAWFTMQAV